MSSEPVDSSLTMNVRSDKKKIPASVIPVVAGAFVLIAMFVLAYNSLSNRIAAAQMMADDAKATAAKATATAATAGKDAAAAKVTADQGVADAANAKAVADQATADIAAVKTGAETNTQAIASLRYANNKLAEQLAATDRRLTVHVVTEGDIFTKKKDNGTAVTIGGAGRISRLLFPLNIAPKTGGSQ